MRIHICAVGRLRAGPELDLTSDYLKRFDRNGRAIGLGQALMAEVEDKKGGGMAAEAALLERAIPGGALICCLDERGRQMSSPAFVIGGADGLDPAFRDRADATLSFGAMVWPHLLVRVMLAEQLYRAASILAGSPYHRA